MKAERRVLFMLCMFVLCAPILTKAQTADCPVAGTVPITSDVRPIATYAGIPTNVNCWNPQDPHVGEAAGEAKKYLASLKTGKNSCIADPMQEFSQVNDAFAICAARFLKAFNDAYGTKPQITRAWNSLQCEAKLCVNNPGCGGFNNSPAPMSNHVRGRALDVTAGAKQEAMIAFANKNPKFGVCFPLASWDKVHLVLAGIPGGEKCPAPNTPCDGVNFDPKILPDPGPPGQTNPNISSATPFGALMQGVQSFFSPPPVPQCPSGYILLNGQCMPQQAQAINQVTSPYTYASPTTAQGSTSGNTIGIGIGGSDTSGSTIGSGINISGMIDTPSSKSGASSSLDLISALANPATASATTATGTVVALNGSLAAKVALQGVQATDPKYLAGSSTYTLAMQAKDTFVSTDLSKLPAAPATYANNSTFGLLENMKQILLSILSLIRPFGGTLPTHNAPL